MSILGLRLYKASLSVLWRRVCLTQQEQTRGYSRAQGLGLTVRNRAPSSHLAIVRPVFSLTGKPLKCPPRLLVPHQRGVVFSILASKSCCTKPTEKHTPSSINGPTAEREACGTRWIHLNRTATVV